MCGSSTVKRDWSTNVVLNCFLEPFMTENFVKNFLYLPHLHLRTACLHLLCSFISLHQNL